MIIFIFHFITPKLFGKLYQHLFTQFYLQYLLGIFWDHQNLQIQNPNKIIFFLSFTISTHNILLILASWIWYEIILKMAKYMGHYLFMDNVYIFLPKTKFKRQNPSLLSFLSNIPFLFSQVSHFLLMATIRLVKLRRK